jgi:hypothetical protein
MPQHNFLLFLLLMACISQLLWHVSQEVYLNANLCVRMWQIWRTPSSGMTPCGSFHLDDGGDIFLQNVLTKTTWHHIPEDGILHSNHRQSLKSYKW